MHLEPIPSGSKRLAGWFVNKLPTWLDPEGQRKRQFALRLRQIRPNPSAGLPGEEGTGSQRLSPRRCNIPRWRPLNRLRRNRGKIGSSLAESRDGRHFAPGVLGQNPQREAGRLPSCEFVLNIPTPLGSRTIVWSLRVHPADKLNPRCCTNPVLQSDEYHRLAPPSLPRELGKWAGDCLPCPPFRCRGTHYRQ